MPALSRVAGSCSNCVQSCQIVKHIRQFDKNDDFRKLIVDKCPSLRKVSQPKMNNATHLNHRTPGQLIQELLDQRGWTKRVLAIILEMNETALNKIMSGARALDAQLALALPNVFEVPEER